MIVAPDILLVIATLVSGFSVAAILSAWADRVFPTVAVAALAAGLGLFVYAYLSLPDHDGWHEIPRAFITVLARFMN